MAGAEQPPAKPGPAKSGLGPRIVSGIVLLALALGAIHLGGLAFAVFIAAMVMIVLWEWADMHDIATRARAGGLILLAAICWLTLKGRAADALQLLAAAMAIGLLLALPTRQPAIRAILPGFAYAGLPAIALIHLRGLADGQMLVLWLCAIVWATDICAYFAGRAIGGPKIWPAISPNKTWAGLAGGMTGAAALSLLVAHLAGWPWSAPALLLAGAGLAIVAQSGDFFESWLKRRAGVKDSGRLLPGHGGVMDRVDGLLPVACVVALLTLVAGGLA